MLSIQTPEGLFSRPGVIFTVCTQEERASGYPISVRVIEETAKILNGSPCRAVIFASREEAEREIIPHESVAVFSDSQGKSGDFNYVTRSRGDSIPAWACGAQWGVNIHEKHGSLSSDRAAQKENSIVRNAAYQLRAHFVRDFDKQLKEGQFPWGHARKGESSPSLVQLSTEIHSVLERLNSGPDMRANLAEEKWAMELPADSKISWFRVPEKPIKGDHDEMQKVTDALDIFQDASHRLLTEDPSVREIVLAGVHFADDPRLPELYLNPPQSRFSVSRPDLHWQGKGKVFLSEQDEMPGGLPELFHMDRAYGINQARWKKALEFLFGKGPVVFIVSHVWSEVYFNDFLWLVGELKSLGYPAKLVSTSDLSGLSIGADGVFVDGEKIGTVWRQFPIFEASGKLVDLIQSARNGLVRLVPEFSHQGNKVWFSIFRSRQGFFRNELDAETYRILDEILPDSHLVLPQEIDGSFPFYVRCANGDSFEVDSIKCLMGLPAERRNEIVMKVVGANRLSARSYGVLMGHGLSLKLWQEWVGNRVDADEPFIVQTKMATAVERIAVFHTGRKSAEAFPCRMLLRPWSFNGQLVSVSVIATPTSTLRVHGMVDMASTCLDLG